MKGGRGGTEVEGGRESLFMLTLVDNITYLCMRLFTSIGTSNTTCNNKRSPYRHSLTNNLLITSIPECHSTDVGNGIQTI